MGQIDGKQIKAATVTDTEVDATVIIASGVNAYTGDQSMGSNKITNLANGTAAADAVNKGQLDASSVGLSWKDPASVKDYLGTRTVAQINSLTPDLGDSVVSSDAGTPTAGASDLLAAGDIAEYNGTDWKKIVANSGGFPPANTRGVVHTETVTLFSPLTDGTDEGKITEWDGSSLTPALTTPVDGEALLVAGETSVNENKAYVYDGTIPSGDWIQFSGLGLVTAGSGLTKTGNTIDAVGGDGITANANDLAVDLKAAGGLKIDTAQIAVEPADFAGNGLQDDGTDNLEIQALNDSVAIAGGGLSAHTMSDSDRNVTASVTVSDDDAAIAGNLTDDPKGSSVIRASVNGVEVFVGDGSKTGEVEMFFSGDGGTTAQAFSAVTTASTVHWRGSVAGYELAATDRISFMYLKA